MFKNCKNIVPRIYNSGSRIDREDLTSTIFNTMELMIKSYQGQFISSVGYLGNNIFAILTPLNTNLVHFLPEQGYFKFDLSYQSLDLEPFFGFENIVELYNITRNETYLMTKLYKNEQFFMQPNEFSELVEDVENSLYRITGYISKQEIINKYIEFFVSSTYSYKEDNSFYILKHLYHQEFEVYEIDFSGNVLYDLDTIIKYIQFIDDVDMGLELMIGVNKKDNVTIEFNTEITIDDIKINQNRTSQQDLGINYLELMGSKDLLYFYVNRSVINKTDINDRMDLLEEKINLILDHLEL